MLSAGIRGHHQPVAHEEGVRAEALVVACVGVHPTQRGRPSAGFKYSGSRKKEQSLVEARLNLCIGDFASHAVVLPSRLTVGTAQQC
eukprot:2175516-Amphidinium_carterae.2